MTFAVWENDAAREATAGYEITRDGRVFSLFRGKRREIYLSLNKNGYLYARLMVNGKRINRPVHRFVAMWYLPPRPSPKHEIRHLDGNPLNNSVDNLAWGTRRENASDRDRHGRTSTGPEHARAILDGIQKSKNPYWRHNHASSDR